MGSFGTGTTLLSAVKVADDVELVSDAPDPDGEMRVTVSCWDAALVRRGTNAKGWVGPPSAPRAEMPDAVGTHALGVEAMVFTTVQVRRCNCWAAVFTRS